MRPSLSRRSFCKVAALAATRSALQAQGPSLAHRNVGELDRDTVLSEAKAALGHEVQPPPEQDFHTETEPLLSTAGERPHPDLLRTDAAALQRMRDDVAALTAGYLVTHDMSFAQAALAHLRPWFITPSSRLAPEFDRAGCVKGSTTGSAAGVVDLVPLAEVARALSFLTDTLSTEEFAAMQTWVAAAAAWLGTNRQAVIAREAKDHRASAWLLLSAAFARFGRDENLLEDCRKRFRTHTLRNQIDSRGVFPQEVATPNPYRNTLMNFDLLTGACELLNSHFDPLWDFELIDGVGLRGAAAYLYPVIAHPEQWRYPADAQHFLDLPGRRPGLLFAGRAYDRPEYVEAWLQRPPVPPTSVAESFPIRQPLLWTATAPHGL